MKNLKELLTALIIILVLSHSIAQNHKKEETLAGIYLTLADFKIDKLTYNVDCVNEKQKIKLHDFFAKPYLDVYHKGKKITLQKKDTYGYKDCHGKTFRFFDNLEYELAESGGISIYFIQQSEAINKSFVNVNDYYFSVKPDGEIKPLTMQNLKSAFPDNHKFHDGLEADLKGNNMAEFDTFHKMYKVNHIYQMSLN